MYATSGQRRIPGRSRAFSLEVQLLNAVLLEWLKEIPSNFVGCRRLLLRELCLVTDTMRSDYHGYILLGNHQ